MGGVLDRSINPYAEGIELLQIGSCNRNRVARPVQVIDVAGTEGRRGNCPHGAWLVKVSSPFVIGKEKQTILPDRPAQRHTEDISYQLVGHIRRPAPGFRTLDEKVVGTGNRVAMVLVKRSVGLVGAALGAQRNLRSRSGPLVGIVVRSGDPKLLHRIECRRQDGSECVPGNLVIHIDAIKRDVALVTARAVDRSAARALTLVDML